VFEENEAEISRRLGTKEWSPSTGAVAWLGDVGERQEEEARNLSVQVEGISNDLTN
jgi:hypothetical protein